MHYIYCTMADFAQCSEEDALHNFKQLLNYANRNWPVVLIIDEFDILFSSSDLKMKKMRVMLQKYFSDATNESVQLFCITNYPALIPGPVLSRLAEILYFDKPSPATLKKLLTHHLGHALGNEKQARKLAHEVSSQTLRGLVGRDIQYIATRIALREARSVVDLIAIIDQVKEDKKNARTFKMEGEKKEEKKEGAIISQERRKLWT